MAIFNNKFLVLLILLFIMFISRGGHFINLINFPDASLIIFLVLGFLNFTLTIFALFFILAAGIDFGVSIFDPQLGFCLTNGYWGLIPTYMVMFFFGRFINKNNLMNDTFNLILVGAFSISLAFIISTNTYYLFSGRFGNPSLFDSIFHGWNYYPEYIFPNLVYLLLFALAYRVKINPSFLVKSK
jgi:hypothetical protein